MLHVSVCCSHLCASTWLSCASHGLHMHAIALVFMKLPKTDAEHSKQSCWIW